MFTLQGVPSTIDQAGYIELGHSAKGKQRWLSACEDVKDMYLLLLQQLLICNTFNLYNFFSMTVISALNSCGQAVAQVSILSLIYNCWMIVWHHSTIAKSLLYFDA